MVKIKSVIFSFVVITMLIPALAHAKVCGVAWRDMGPTPDADVGAVPQGLSGFSDFGEDVLIMTIEYEKAQGKYKGQGSRVYFIPLSALPLTKEKISKLKYSVLPIGYQHVSSVALDFNQKDLYLVDYRLNILIHLDMKETLENKYPSVVSLQSTGLHGSSGLVQFDYNNQKFMGISDFSLFNADKPTTIFNVSGCSLKEPYCKYPSQGRSQGLSYAMIEDQPMLIESVNQGIVEGFTPVNGTTDKIRFYDLKKLMQNKSGKDSFMYEFNAPGTMVEDVTFDSANQILYTADEHSYHMYAGELMMKDQCN